MKLTSVNQSLPSLETVRERPDRQDKNDRRNQQQKDNEKKQEAPPSIPVSDQKVLDAIQAFQVDSQSITHDLHVALSGQGPGLKVVLTDGRGAVIRQFTGEEFVQMREAVSKEGRSRGKLLDQKI